jgi:Flp pilus assembly protein TadD
MVAWAPAGKSNTEASSASKRDVFASFPGIRRTPEGNTSHTSEMVTFALKRVAFFAALTVPGFVCAWAADNVAIKIPLRSRLSPVQQLNRDGVEAIKKHDYNKAESLFMKAYLYDPADPFTLNNLGYISELTGQIDRAHRFYQLSAEQSSNAEISVSNAKSLEGKPMKAALENLQDGSMRANRMNLEAMQLLKNNKGFEAAALLNEALKTDPRNPFTLNNLGVAEEAVGDYQNALRDYRAAAASGSQEPAVITLDSSWGGRPVSEIAAASANRLQKRIQDTASAGTRASMYTLRGVTAGNENDWATARQDFLRAYTLDPTSAFSLNNRGFVAEMDGDLESAQYFYEKARTAAGANARIGLATDHSAEGKTLITVADDSNHKVDGALVSYSQERRRQTGPIELTPRGPSSAPPPH